MRERERERESCSGSGCHTCGHGGMYSSRCVFTLVPAHARYIVLCFLDKILTPHSTPCPDPRTIKKKKNLSPSTENLLSYIQ